MQNDVSPQLFLAFLNDAWNRAGNGANAFRAQLLQDSTDALSLVKKGSVGSVGKNTAHQTYQGYGAGQLTQVQVAETVSTLIGLYDQLKDKITREFCESADFDYEVPPGFDFDGPIADPVTGLLTAALSALCAGHAKVLPDITRIRLTPSTILNPALVTW